MAESPDQRKARLDKELAELKSKSNPTDADKARMDVIENAESEMKPSPAEKVEANRNGGQPELERRGSKGSSLNVPEDLSAEERVARLNFGA